MRIIATDRTDWQVKILVDGKSVPHSRSFGIEVGVTDGGKFELKVTERLFHNDTGATVETGQPHRWRASSIEQLVPLSASSFEGELERTIRNCVYSADDAYAAEQDIRAKEFRTLLIGPYKAPMTKKRIEPQNPPPPPISAENFRHDPEIRKLLLSWGHELEVPKLK